MVDLVSFDLGVNIVFILCITAFAAGFIDAVAGGGGLLTIPALLSAGLPAHVALGTNKLAATFGSSTASFTFYRKKLFSPKFWYLSTIATAIGAFGGTFIVDLLSKDFLDKILPVIIFATALYTLFNRIKPDDNINLPEQNNALKQKQIIQGITLGFYDGAVGPGTGAFWTVSSTVLYKMNLLLSSGLARAMNFVSNACSLIAFTYLGHINYLLGITMGVCLMIGAYIGAHCAISLGSKFIRPAFITVVLIMAGKLAWQAWT